VDERWSERTLPYYEQGQRIYQRNGDRPPENINNQHYIHSITLDHGVTASPNLITETELITLMDKFIRLFCIFIKYVVNFF
jgi:hypothetical protein